MEALDLKVKILSRQILLSKTARPVNGVSVSTSTEGKLFKDAVLGELPATRKPSRNGVMGDKPCLVVK
jgi:hypothetical protein